MQAITATRRIAKQDLKRSIVTESGGIPLGAVPAAANRRDDGLLAATLDTWSWSVCCPPSRWCTWTPATTTSPAGRSWPNTGWSARSPREACRYQSRRAAAAGGAHPRLGQPGRQAALVHRAPPAGGGVLVGVGQRRHRLWPAHPPRLDPLPLAGPPAPPPMTAYWRRLLACVLTRRAGWGGRRPWSAGVEGGWTGQAAVAVVGGFLVGFLAGFLTAGWRVAGPRLLPLGRPGERPEGFGALAGDPRAHSRRETPRRTR
jgi:hypothetical protein